MKAIIQVITILSFGFSNYLLADCQKKHHSITSPVDYYSEISSTEPEELKKDLNALIRGHTRYNYTPCVWSILKEADQDPDNSDNVIGIYTNRSIPKTDQDNGRNGGNSWNREHIWAKSHGFPKKNQHGYTDAHHIRAADRSVNTDRSNNDFDNGGEPDDECIECSEGDHTWEAPDRVKGDIARMMFYMVVRYEGNDFSKTPDLELFDRKTKSGKPEFGKLCTLMQWHKSDTVDGSERKRNDIVQSWQGNRNPFIDHPEYAFHIWGDECDIKEEPEKDTLKQKILDRIKQLEKELGELKELVKQL